MINRIWRALLDLIRKNRAEQEMDEELRSHLERQIEHNTAQGMDAEEARYAALRLFGGMEQLKEQCRDVRGVNFIETIIQDLRYGVRQLRRNPGFTAVAVLTLALGIGANTAIFSVINAVMLRMLPVHDPEQLVLVALQGKRSGQSIVSESFSYPLFEELRQHNQVFTDILAFSAYRGSSEAHLGNSDSAANEPLKTEMVSANFFSVLGVSAMIGRTFAPDEDHGIGAHPVAVISYGLWTRLFARNTAALGKRITIGDTALTIVGVASQHFSGVRPGRACDVWIPVSMGPQVVPGLPLTGPDAGDILTLMARLKPGVSVEQARVALDLLYQQIQRQQEASKQGAQDRQGVSIYHIVLLPAAHGTDYLRNQFKQPLFLLMGIVVQTQDTVLGDELR